MMLFGVILMYLISPFVILAFAPIYLAFFIWRTFVKISLWAKFGSGASLMRSVDSAPVHWPLRCPEALSCILIEVAGNVEISALRQRIRNNLLDVKDPASGQFKHRRLRQAVCRYRGYFIWKDVQDFRLENHVDFLRQRDTGEIVSFKDEADRARIVNVIINDSDDVFEFGRPCWKFLVVPRVDAKSTLIVLMSNHCMWDAGATGMVLVPALCDGVVENPFMHMKSVPGWARAWLYFKGLFGLPLFLVSQACGPADRNPIKARAQRSAMMMPKNGQKSPGKFSYWEGSVPIATVKEIKNSTGHKFNDVVLTAVARALRKYFISLNPGKVYLWSAMLLYNQLSFNVLPVWMVERLLKRLAGKPTMAITLFRGSGQILKMFGHVIDNFHGVLSIPQTTPLGVLVQSNAGELAINVTGLKTAFPTLEDLKVVHRFISEEIEVLAQEVRQLKEESGNGVDLKLLNPGSVV
ncbi:unnamed protein product [Notodromas monacha]|uniref:O-acyltransferase WSD1 C-terminal domain-containing protein n=1 Tax=Notodromas monacha TaxID=399045 RepID=A0A7R9BVB5_9CRUS|nr:unnamed protein product [Notodromas monacha]CAG0920792.1 unnamed protein product [Notodromas monacha]